MRRIFMITAASISLFAQMPAARAQRPVHTFSIVARDPITGDLGIAVQSHWFNVGSGVIHAEPGVGAVATQSIPDIAYGPLGLQLMKAGKSAPEALKALVAVDAEESVRQVGMVDAQGRAASHTGSMDIPEAGGIVGEGFAVQANMMAKNTVWPEMAKAYREGLKDPKLDLADRLLAALRAAQAQGGDFRGMQSAAILIVKAKPSGQPWNDKLFDLRVEDSPDPIAELSRLVQLQRAYQLMNAGDAFVSKNQWKPALEAYSAAAKLAPQIVELPYWHAVALVNGGRVQEALPIFKEVFRREPRWRAAARRLAKVKQLPNDEAILKLIEAQ
ncbi:MAG: DUF1028 domain-containing protein [Holophagaceae bacterium]|nr:DUF1028 domain-containing protein [Holophagaceae bacterium]